MKRRGALTAVLLAALAVAAAFSVMADLSRSSSRLAGLATNANLDPGTPLSGRAPDFALTDQFGRRVSLHSFRGRVVILAFNDSKCTTVCPLTTAAMVEAKDRLGSARAAVQLLGVDANPEATTISDVRSYSQAHGMLREWHFLTGPKAKLERVWRAYKIAVAIEHGQIDHTPALFVIDPQGRLAKLYITQMSYASIGQLGQLLAQEAAGLLPGHPRVGSLASYDQIPGLSPTARAGLPAVGGKTAQLGPGSPRLLLFFATWLASTSNLAEHLVAMNRYEHLPGRRLPELIGVDEGSVETSSRALTRFLHTLTAPLAYPLGIDRSGRVADGYGVQDQPWLVLVSSTGRILWYRDLSTQGWPAPADLAHDVRAAMARPPGAPTSAGAAERALVGSPKPLAALHRQSGQLLGTESSLAVRLRALRGYPVVLNAWASWCAPCRSEFGLFASASARYGRGVAFLGADTDDSGGDAQSFLAQHPVSYPSYQSTITRLGSIAVLAGLPSTIFINRAGKVVYVHVGQYDAQGSLDDDIARYALVG
jgi:cytochrome oxidase Cu insertion factor (SCO1/SenC/PrrC family)/thiol-disulfide isomerase/thioredoxin